ncbi:MAG: methyltransferase domain-containing protein [Acidimicrobiia bacterium]
MSCPVCGSADARPVTQVAGMPVLCNAFAATAEEARAMARGEIDLRVCGTCGMLHNAAFDPALAPYDNAYENSLHFSPRFQEFAGELSADLVRRFGGPGRTVVEIGSGAGDFLEMVAPGFGTAVGIDPSLAAASEREVGGTPLRLLPGDIDQAPEGLRADLLLSRHVLEHVPDPVALLRAMRERLAGSDTHIYVEVPDAGHMLRAGAVWDLIYEHVGYFTQPALVAALAAAGWHDIATGTSFGGQYLWAEAAATARAGDDLTPAAEVDTVTAAARHFGEVYRDAVTRWTEFLEGERRAGARVAIWGAGSKGVAFTNTLAPDVEVIDVNPRKRGRHVPGTGVAVSAPADVAGTLDTVLVMNGLYLDEIERSGKELGLDARYVAVDR